MNAISLADFIKQITELPIIALVDGDVTPDGPFGRFAGKFGTIALEDVCFYNGGYYTDRNDFEEDYYGANEDALCKKFGFSPIVKLSTFPTEEEKQRNADAERELDDYLHSLSDRYFKKAVLVYVDPIMAFDEVPDEGGKMD